MTNKKEICLRINEVKKCNDGEWITRYIIFAYNINQIKLLLTLKMYIHYNK